MNFNPLPPCCGFARSLFSAAILFVLTIGANADPIQPGDTIKLIRKEPLLFREQPFRDGEEGETFSVLARRPETGRVFVLLKDKDGKDIAASIPDNAVTVVAKASTKIRERAVTAAKAGNLDEATRLIVEALKADPKDPELLAVSQAIITLGAAKETMEKAKKQQAQANVIATTKRKNAAVTNRPNPLAPNDTSNQRRAEVMREEAQAMEAEAKLAVSNAQSRYQSALEFIAASWAERPDQSTRTRASDNNHHANRQVMQPIAPPIARHGLELPEAPTPPSSTIPHEPVVAKPVTPTKFGVDQDVEIAAAQCFPSAGSTFKAIERASSLIGPLTSLRSADVVEVLLQLPSYRETLHLTEGDFIDLWLNLKKMWANRGINAPLFRTRQIQSAMVSAATWQKREGGAVQQLAVSATEDALKMVVSQEIRTLIAVGSYYDALTEDERRAPFRANGMSLEEAIHGTDGFQKWLDSGRFSKLYRLYVPLATAPGARPSEGEVAQRAQSLKDDDYERACRHLDFANLGILRASAGVFSLVMEIKATGTIDPSLLELINDIWGLDTLTAELNSSDELRNPAIVLKAIEKLFPQLSSRQQESLASGYTLGTRTVLERKRP